MFGCSATSSGYTSISFTTQSESVPLVDATRFAIGCPSIFTGAVNASVVNTATSVRPEGPRWSVTSHRGQIESPSYPNMRTGRGTNGTGFAGSDTYSS